MNAFFENKNQVIIKVKLAAPAKTWSDATVKPFEYSFVFTNLRVNVAFINRLQQEVSFAQ